MYGSTATNTPTPPVDPDTFPVFSSIMIFPELISSPAIEDDAVPLSSCIAIPLCPDCVPFFIVIVPVFSRTAFAPEFGFEFVRLRLNPTSPVDENEDVVLSACKFKFPENTSLLSDVA